MTFEGQYLTYEEYVALVESMGGSAIDEMPFNLLEFEARKSIDVRTKNRLKQVEEIPVEVKLCEYHLIEKIQLYQNETNRNITSESVGSYSIGYDNDIEKIVKSKEKELDDIIINDLYGVIINDEHVIYLGD